VITQKLVKELFHYVPETGELIRLKNAGSAKTGDLAGCLFNTGYILTSIKGKFYQNHRIIFLYFHGYLPEQVDHINGIRSDNKIENLRTATHKENMRNHGKHKNNTSGVKGVHWNKREKRWQAQIKADGKLIYLGLFITIGDAEKIVRKKRVELHGEFANHGDSG